MPRPPTKKLAQQLGARIVELRDEIDLSQEKLAYEIGISKPYLSQIEAGKRSPTLAVLSLLAERLGLEVADLVALEQRKPRLALLEAARKKDRAAVRAALKRLGLL